MALSREAIPITSSTTLAFENRDYIVSSSGSNFTLTLPLITCDGIRLTISRQDNYVANVIFINTTSPNTIVLSKITSTNSYSLLVGTTIQLLSESKNWTMISANYNDYLFSRSLIAGSFTSNMTNSYILCTGANLNTVVLLKLFSRNSTDASPSSMTVNVYKIGTIPTFSGKIVLSTDSTATTVIMSITVTSLAAGFNILSTSTLVNAATGGTMYLTWTPTVGSVADTIGLYSITVV